ncbi:zinc finger BED domain-containing protein 6-like [Gastrophryne carolinensis]
MSQGGKAEACEASQQPLPPEAESDDVYCVEIPDPAPAKDEAAMKVVPEIEFKLESSDEEEEEENKSEQSSASSAPSHKRKLPPYSAYKALPGHCDANPMASRPTRKRKSTSEVWEFFIRDPGNVCRAICGLCKMSVSRGKLGGNFGTTALKRHLECKHPLEWAHRKSMREQKPEEEEEEETCEDEEEKDYAYTNPVASALACPPGAPYAPHHMLQTPNAAESSRDPGSPKTYEIIDSSDEDGDILRKFGQGKRKRADAAQDSGFSTDLGELPGGSGGLEDAQPAIAFTIPHYSAVPLGARRRKSISAVWQFFCIDPTNICRAICTLCQTSVSRGKLGGHFGTSALMRHMEGKHPLEWGRGKYTKLSNISAIEVEDEDDEELEEQMMYSEVPYGHFGSAYPPVYPGVGDLMTHAQHNFPAQYDEGAGALAQSNLPPGALPCFKDDVLPPPGVKLKPSGKYPPSHPKAQAWNRRVTELICEMALPYSFISSRAFQKFMASADPLYTVPTKSFFSTKAVPSLYRSVCAKMVSELKRSACPYIHVSTHMWSGDLTADYLALSAHWCIVNPDAIQPAERKHAVLCIRPFPKEFNEAGIQQELIRQVNLWLTSHALTPGFLTSNRDFNLVQAIKGAGYTYVPCFTDSLNLLIKDFLQNNRYITGMLATARKVCNHFIHSARARKILAELQSQNRLPKQSLKLETGLRWTSTFYMLQRLLEQQKSVQAYQAMHKVEMVNILLTPSHWNLMLSLVDLLLPFEMATREVNSHSSSLSQVLPELRYLHIFLKQIRGHFESRGDANGVVLADSFAFKLSADYGVNEMFQKEEYVLATLLDPRFKGRIEAILPPESDIDHWKQILVRKVKEVMSSANSPQAGASASQFRDGGNSEAEMFSSKYIDREASGPQWRRSMATPPLIHKEKSLIEHLESVGLLASKSTGASLSTESHSACVMVEKYFQDNKTIGAKDDPLTYWQKRTWLWPALTKLAIMYLTCPPSSVFAERVFKSPQPFMNKQFSSDVMEGMEHLVFLKVNLENFPNYSPPTLIFSDNEAEQSDSDDGI